MRRKAHPTPEQIQAALEFMEVRPRTVLEVIEARSAGVPCSEQPLPEGIADLRAFVIAKNGESRRHLSASQLAQASVDVYAWLPSGRDHDQRTGSALSADLEAKSASEIAEAAGVSARMVERAKKVRSKAVPEVVEAVKAGTIGLKKAEAIAKLPREEQAAALADLPSDADLPKRLKSSSDSSVGDETLRRFLLNAAGERSAPFFISVRVAGDLIDRFFTAASKVFRGMTRDGLLQLVELGTGNKASRYRYVGPAFTRTDSCVHELDEECS